MTEWTDTEDALLKRYYITEGHSASYTATQIGNGRSRNACIGRAHRLGWMRPAGIGVANSKRAANARQARQVRFAPSLPRKPRAPRKPPVAVAPLITVGTDGHLPDMAFQQPEDIVTIRFFDRTARNCAWPVGPVQEPGHMDMAVCGAAVVEEGRPYCARHQARSLAPTQPKPMSKWNPDAPITRRHAA